MHMHNLYIAEIRLMNMNRLVYLYHRLYVINLKKFRHKPLPVQPQIFIYIFVGLQKAYRREKYLAHRGIEPVTFALLARRSNQLS